MPYALAHASGYLSISAANSIFDAARRISDPEKRLAFLEDACRDNPPLREHVNELLRKHDRPDSFLNCAAEDSIDADGVPNPSEIPASSEDVEAAALFDFLTPSTNPDALGKLSHYDILSELGRGAFGTVFKAFDESLHRTVAIKVLSRELAATSPARKRFLREARSAAAIRHENVVHIYRVEEKPRPFLVMEYIPGETLQQRLDQNGPLDLPDVLRLGLQIASGLAAAHAKGLVHRDIKPSNILLEIGSQDWVKISDFGLARAVDDASITHSGVIAGTPLYMAPEQALGTTVDQRADLFSLGSVLYVMVSGRPPFRAPTTLAVLKRVTEENARPIHEIIRDVPAWLCALISKLHAKRPADRIQSASEVADLLSQHLNGLRQPDGATGMDSAGDTVTVQYQPRPRAVERNTTAVNRTYRLRAVLGYAFLTLAVMLLGGIGFQLANRDRGTPAIDDPARTKLENSPTTGAKNSVLGRAPSTVADASLAIDFAAERSAAEWVIGIGGDVTLRDANDQSVPLIDKKLPGTNFLVHEVNIFNATFRDADLGKLRACSSLDTVAFAHTRRLTDSSLFHLEGAQIRHLNLVQCPSLTDNATRSIATLRGLIELELKSPNFTDDCVAALKPLERLESANFSLSRITNGGLAHLAKVCPQITTLTVSNSLDQKQDTDAFKYFPNLKIAIIDGGQLSDETVHVINTIAGLSTLSIFPPLSDDTILRLQGLRQIRTLTIASNGDQSNARISATTYRNAVWPKCIETLNFSGQAVSPRDQDLAVFAKLPNLRVLGIGGSQIPHLTEAGVYAFRKRRPDVLIGFSKKYQTASNDANPKFVPPAAAVPIASLDPERKAAEWVLAIGGTVTLRDANDQPVPVLNRKLPGGDIFVQNVDIYDNQFNGEDLACLQGCEKLDIVAFSRTSRLTDSALAHLEGARIKSLAFTDCPSLTSLATRTIGTVQGLKSLNLQSPGFADDGVADLESLKQLDVVNCGLTRLTDLGLTQLAKACPQITELAIWQSSDQRQTVRAVGAFPNLRTVFINGDQFTDDAIKVFNAHPTLGTLYIATSLSDPTIHRLKGLERIRRLFIQSNGSEDKALISEATYRNATWPDSVHSLYFVGHAVSPRDPDLVRFAQCPNLKVLGIDSAATPLRLTQTGIDAFRKLRPDIYLGVNHKSYPPTDSKPSPPANRPES